VEKYHGTNCGLYEGSYHDYDYLQLRRRKRERLIRIDVLIQHKQMKKMVEFSRWGTPFIFFGMDEKRISQTSIGLLF
jgi:hypothetical protein